MRDLQAGVSEGLLRHTILRMTNHLHDHAGSPWRKKGWAAEMRQAGEERLICRRPDLRGIISR